MKWLPYLVDAKGNRTPLILPKTYRTIQEIQQWFHTLPVTHPKLVGKRIDWEETPEPGDSGS